jgi:subfamily B ATP-binding cassette protein MsbA
MAFVVKSVGDYGDLPPFVAAGMRLVQQHLDLEVLVILFIIVFFGKNLLRFMVQYGNARIANRVRGEWMNELFSKYIYSNYSLLLNTKQGILVSNLFHLTAESVAGLKRLVVIFTSLIISSITLLALLLISWQVTLASVTLVVMGYFFLTKPIVAKALNLGTHRVGAYQEVNSIPAESFRGIREIKSYTSEGKIIDYYKNATKYMIDLRVKLNFYQLLPTVLPEILFVTFLSVILIILNRMASVNLNSIFPLMVTYAYASLRLFNNGGDLVNQILSFSSQWPSIQALYNEMYAEENREVDRGVLKVGDMTGSLRFVDVSFSYDVGNVILKGINTEFERGTFTAIVGSSGVGKSTIADLVMRLYKPDSGFIYYDEQEIDEYKLICWRKQVGFVSQETFLFHSTIRENIMLGMKGEVFEEEMIEAAKKANAHEFIMNTEKGYDTIVGESGAKLSGGQRQRIAIARALIREPTILILDEATSTLDLESEISVMKALEKIKDDLILIVITHRISSVINADKIIVMKNGEIIEQGLHLELIQGDSEYQKLYSFMQSGKNVSSKDEISLA